MVTSKQELLPDNTVSCRVQPESAISRFFFQMQTKLDDFDPQRKVLHISLHINLLVHEICISYTLISGPRSPLSKAGRTWRTLCSVRLLARESLKEPNDVQVHWWFVTCRFVTGNWYCTSPGTFWSSRIGSLTQLHRRTLTTLTLIRPS
ncbi:hypothetical protein FPOAC1_012428 [Fusarium poae]|uniref:hypothetical protein n=1 Tax=Fusarium poae TaxID=36050 RepID=UPI001CE9B3CF|nr:hypothetical protein FPOAC1_012428 [Fusarium poae]KAG8667595.1 hypothetical protein FPOAC1_012428 [Fusarium poae]